MLMPFVSCIMPTTAARKKFIPLAMEYFLRQDYANTELIVLDEGEESVESLIPGTERIRYVRYPGSFSSLGDKRNYACSLAKGETILHWDDDDWYAPDWISRQVAMLESQLADICGLNTLYFFNPLLGQAWKYVYSYNRHPWVAGATLAYRKSVWERRPFRSVDVGEDNQFVWYSEARVVAHEYAEGFVSILHGRNTSPKHTDDAQWTPVPVAEVVRIMGDDLLRYR